MKGMVAEMRLDMGQDDNMPAESNIRFEPENMMDELKREGYSADEAVIWICDAYASYTEREMYFKAIIKVYKTDPPTSWDISKARPTPRKVTVVEWQKIREVNKKPVISCYVDDDKIDRLMYTAAEQESLEVDYDERREKMLNLKDECVLLLAPRQRQAIELYQQGYTETQVGEVMGISQPAVFKLLQAAHRNLPRLVAKRQRELGIIV